MKIKLFVIVVLVTIIFASTIAIAAKPSDLPEQANNKGQSFEKQMARYIHLDQLAYQFWIETGSVPEGINNALERIGR